MRNIYGILNLDITSDMLDTTITLADALEQKLDSFVELIKNLNTTKLVHVNYYENNKLLVSGFAVKYGNLYVVGCTDYVGSEINGYMNIVLTITAGEKLEITKQEF